MLAHRDFVPFQICCHTFSHLHGLAARPQDLQKVCILLEQQLKADQGILACSPRLCLSVSTRSIACALLGAYTCTTLHYFGTFFVVMFVNLKYVRPLVAFTIKMKFILRYLAWSISCGSKMTSGSIFLKEILICEIFSFHLAKLNLLYFKISRYVCNFSSGSLNNPDADNPDAACLLS